MTCWPPAASTPSRGQIFSVPRILGRGRGGEGGGGVQLGGDRV